MKRQVKRLIKFALGKTKKLQENLLVEALKEVSIDPRKCRISIDHDRGVSEVNGVKLGIIYPKRYFYTSECLPASRQYEYYFNGYPGDDNGRRDMLRPYQKEDSQIIFSRDGRNIWKKNSYNRVYYVGMKSARFALCPHQLDWKGDKDCLWTYRFIEACMCRSIPILFRRTPLSDAFTDGIKYYWDDEPHLYDEEITSRNFCESYKRFTLSEAEIAKLR